MVLHYLTTNTQFRDNIISMFVKHKALPKKTKHVSFNLSSKIYFISTAYFKNDVEAIKTIEEIRTHLYSGKTIISNRTSPIF